MALQRFIMLFFLLIASASIVIAADAEVKEELKPAESIHNIHHDEYYFTDGLELMRHRDQELHSERHRILKDYGHSYHEDPRHPSAHKLDEDDLPGPVILRMPDPLPHHGHPDIEAQNRIIEDVFSPDYYQPTWILDYKYLKTGGRDYTRGPGEQILILPKGVHSKEPKEFTDYNAYLEHLRLSHLAKEQHHRHGNEEDHHRNRQYTQGYRHNYHGHEHDHEHGQTMWRRY